MQKKNKNVQPLGSDSQLTANRDAAIHQWFVGFFSVCRVPFCLLDIYTDREELRLKSRPKVQCLRRFKKNPQKWPNLRIISSPFPFNPGKQNNYDVRESLPTLAVASFFFLVPPLPFML